MKPKHNPLAAWLREYLASQPNATPAQAWSHLTQVAIRWSMVPIRCTEDGARLVYITQRDGNERTLCRLSFDRAFWRAKRPSSASAERHNPT